MWDGLKVLFSSSLVDRNYKFWEMGMCLCARSGGNSCLKSATAGTWMTQKSCWGTVIKVTLVLLFVSTSELWTSHVLPCPVPLWSAGLDQVWRIQRTPWSLEWQGTALGGWTWGRGSSSLTWCYKRCVNGFYRWVFPTLYSTQLLIPSIENTLSSQKKLQL